MKKYLTLLICPSLFFMSCQRYIGTTLPGSTSETQVLNSKRQSAFKKNEQLDKTAILESEAQHIISLVTPKPPIEENSNRDILKQVAIDKDLRSELNEKYPRDKFAIITVNVRYDEAAEKRYRVRWKFSSDDANGKVKDSLAQIIVVTEKSTGKKSYYDGAIICPPPNPCKSIGRKPLFHTHK